MVAGWQGFDAGRWGTFGDCPYPPESQDKRAAFLRHAWGLGFVRGQKVEPRHEPRTFEHHPVTFNSY